MMIAVHVTVCVQYIETVFSLLFHLLKEVRECDTKVRLLCVDQIFSSVECILCVKSVNECIIV